jgi:hypothetical protein
MDVRRFWLPRPLLQWQVVFPTNRDAILLEGKRLVDVRRFELPTPCLQSSGVLSNSSFLSLGFQCFQQFGESAFAQKLTPMN